MTISSTDDPRAGPFTGNGSQTAFPFEFKTFAKADLLVTLTDEDGLDTDLVLDSDFSVTLNADQDGDPGGTVTYPISGDELTSGETLTITSDLDFVQETDIQNAGGFFAQVIEDALDRLAMLVKQVNSKASRALRVSVTTPDDVDVVLPPPSAQKIIGWDDTATSLVNRDIGDFATVVAFAAWQSQYFDGDGVTTQFALSGDPGNVNNLDVVIGGAGQGTNDYSVSGTTLTFTSAPPAGTDNIFVRWGEALPQSVTNANAVNFTPVGAGASVRTVETKLREVKSFEDFGMVGDGTQSTADAWTFVQAAWASALANGHDLLHPGGTYDIGDHSYPWRQTDLPAALTDLLDCQNITIYGIGPQSIFKTTSAGGADVFQLNGVKNLHLRNFAITATLTGSSGSGSNGMSVTGGFDNVTALDIWIYDCPSLDQTSFIDGGKALSFQSGVVTPECGTFTARIYAQRCSMAVNVDIDQVEWLTKKAAIGVEFTAEDCFAAVSIGSPASSAAIAAGTHTGIKVRGQSINCQRDLTLGRIHGVNADVQVITTKTAAARRLDGAGVAWQASDTEVEALKCTYAKNSQLRVHGYKGACDYKARIGGASAGSSGLSGATEHCDIFLDVGGTAATANVIEVDSGGNTMANSTLRVTSTTATTLPTAFQLPANNNDLAVGGKLTGTVTLTLTGCTTSPTGDATWTRQGDVITMRIPTITGTSNLNTATLTGLPAELRPVSTQGCNGMTTDNGTTLGSRINVGTGGVIDLFNGYSSGIYTAAGTKGIQFCTIHYMVT